MSAQGQVAVRVDEQFRQADRQGDGRIAIDDVKPLIESLFYTVMEDVRAENQALVAELQELLSYIGNAKGEMLSLRPRTLSSRNIPDANDELNAIIGATDEAAGRIMDAADQVGEISASMKGKKAQQLEAISTELYEASSFQDICGQRITKVVGTLRLLEERLSGLAEAIGDEHVADSDDSVVEFDETGHAVNAADLLHGPQLEGEGISQADVDALFD